MKVLIVAIDPTRWGPARLPAPLRQAGFEVAALCPPDNPLAHTRFLDARFNLPETRRFPLFAAALGDAMEAFEPRLVIPADEMTVVLLHAATGRASALSRRALSTIRASLCPEHSREAMLFKNECQELTRRIGVRTPAGGPVRSREEARARAADLGYPVVLKQSFGWGGTGVRLSRDAASLDEAFEALRPRPVSLARRLARRALGRDWYPAPGALWAQQAIDGYPAMYSFVAVEGRLLAGFAGVPRALSSASGPSTVVDFGAHAGMEEASERMALAMGCTGFVSFDFMIERATGDAFLLECNARPNQVSHLGERVGADLCASLFSGLSGEQARAPVLADREETVALFPQEWLRDAESPALRRFHHDVPRDDDTLLARCLAAAPAARSSFLRVVMERRLKTEAAKAA